jgi:membrane protein required for colicin V production
MSIFDISLIIILAGFMLSGLFKGLIRTVGRVVGLFLGAYVASHYYLVLYDWGQGLSGGHENAAKVVAFILLFIIVSWAVDLIFGFLKKAFKFIAVIPGSKYIDNLLGAILGFIGGAIFLGLILLVISKYALLGNFFGDQLTESKMAPFLILIAKITSPFLSQALVSLKSLI